MNALVDPSQTAGPACRAAGSDSVNHAARRAWRRRRHSRRDRRGAIVVLTAILMVALLGLVALVVDLGYLMLAQTQLQDAADSAALAGSAVLAQGPAAARAEAQRFASLNTSGKTPVSVDPAHDIVLGHWDSVGHTFVPLSGADEANADSIQVTCRLSASGGSPLFFSSLWGTQTANPTAVSLAQSQCTQCGPFIGLNEVLMLGNARTDSYSSWAGPYSAATAGSQGTLCSNGPIGLVGNVSVHGDAHPGPGQVLGEVGHASVSGSTAPRATPLQLPPVNFGTAATANNNQNIPMTAKGRSPLNGRGAFTLNGHDTLTLPPGTYYFSSVKITGSSSLLTNGQTVIYCTGDFDVSGGSLINSTQLPRNLQIYCTGQICTLSGSTDFYGTIYGPSTRLVINGSAELFGTLVGADLLVTGNARLHADQSLGPLQGCLPFPRILN